jgi:hypothetical protein
MRRGVFYVIHMFSLTCLLLKVVFNTITLTHVYPKGQLGGCHGRDRMVVGFTTTYAIRAYHHNHIKYTPPHSYQRIRPVVYNFIP